MSHIPGFDLAIDWNTVFMIGVVFLIVFNMHLGISYTTMLLPFRGIFPELGGFDTMIIISLILIFFREHWSTYGWLVTFAIVFGFIWLIS